MTRYPAGIPSRPTLADAIAAGCTPRELDVVRLKNEDASERVAAAALGISRSAVRVLYARAIRRVLDGPVSDYRAREIVVPLDEEIRGWPATGRGVGGAIRGTRPGDDPRFA